ncbi:unnamed protein product [Dicrocoelium dendriticum]|nr:unnamed protein product [Dicrocoelium dendriticum]
MSMNLRQLDQLRRRQLRILGTNTGLRNSLTYASQARTGVALCFGQTWELIRRILLVHFIRGPTCIFAMLLSFLMIAGSAFWPTVGLLVISDSESSLMGRTTIESDFPVNMPKWYVGYDGSQPDSELQAVGRKLLAHLSHIQRVPSDEHWCGMFLNCSEHVYLGIDPTKTGVLYPRNPYYVILVRRVFGDIFGYHIYLPYKTFHTTATATKIFLPLKEQVDNFFLEANRKGGATPFSTRIRLQVAATKRDIYAESPERWSMGKGGKLFIISVMSAHQYLSTACLVVCFASIMCLDKETGFRPLMALMGMRRVSYLLAHFLICQVGVLILAACGTFVHMALGTELTDRQPIQSDYGTMFGTNVIISWHQFGIGLILCSLTRSTRSVMFPLLALFASLVLGQLVMTNRVLEDVLWQRESSIDENGYLIPSYALASLHIQVGEALTVRSLGIPIKNYLSSRRYWLDVL